MFHAAFRSYCPIRDKSSADFMVCLDDDAIERILRALDGGSGDVRVSVQRTLQAHDESLTLAWDSDAAGFWVREGRLSVGFVPFDEMRGALGKRLGADEVPVQVCLRGELDVWRRGVFSPSKGKVLVYTATSGLGFLGMEAFIVRGGGRAECFSLSGGDPCREPLQAPLREMEGVARAGQSMLAVDRQAALGGLAKQLEPFA